MKHYSNYFVHKKIKELLPFDINFRKSTSKDIVGKILDIYKYFGVDLKNIDYKVEYLVTDIYSKAKNVPESKREAFLKTNFREFRMIIFKDVEELLKKKYCRELSLFEFNPWSDPKVYEVLDVTDEEIQNSVQEMFGEIVITNQVVYNLKYLWDITEYALNSFSILDVNAELFASKLEEICSMVAEVNEKSNVPIAVNLSKLDDVNEKIKSYVVYVSSFIIRKVHKKQEEDLQSKNTIETIQQNKGKTINEEPSSLQETLPEDVEIKSNVDIIERTINEVSNNDVQDQTDLDNLGINELAKILKETTELIEKLHEESLGLQKQLDDNKTKSKEAKEYLKKITESLLKR